ncbi:MAG: putative transrane efflux protein [Actinomycetia bacterium]|nr:putative transrane efflux protein [Actinomycetes bacterium]
MTSTAPEAGADVQGHPQRWWALVVLCLTLGMVALDNSILNVALPHIRDQLGASESGLQWITTAYSLVLAGLLLPIAVIGDRHGRKELLLAGLGLFGVASLLAAFTTSTAVLVAARALMGVGGACAMPATLAIIGNIFPEDERARAIVFWSATAGLTSAAGPIVGGLLVDRFWWGSVFLVNVPFAAALVVAAVVLVPDSSDPNSPRVDRRSAFAWWAALTATLYAIIEVPQQGFRSPWVLAAIAAAVVLFVLFRIQERRTDGPLVDAETAADPRLWAGMATMGAMFLTLLGSQFVVTQWLQGPRSLGALEAGLCFVPSAVASVTLGLLNTRFVARWSHATIAATGLGLVAVGALGAGGAILAGSVPATAALFTLIGAGVGLAAPSGAELIMSSAPPARAGSAAGVNETIVEAFGSLGVAVLGSVLAGSHSFARPLPVAAVVAAAAAVLVHRLLRPQQAPS